MLLVNGDSHLYEPDRPLADPSNLTRITVDGSTNFHDWVKLVVDPATPAVFGWTRIDTP